MGVTMPVENVEGRRSRLSPVACDASTHTGLWHDVFPPVLRPKSTEALTRSASHLKQMCSRPVPDGYSRAFEQRKALLFALRGDIHGAVTWLYEATVAGRMIVGLGVGSVLEHQVRLQHTWGVPEIPGSGLKGLASTTAHRYGGDPWKKSVLADGQVTPTGLDHQSLFGDTSHGGLVTFHDAWWIPEGTSLPIDLDVMTVHQRAYYRDPTQPPSDTEEPNPVSFLTTRGTYLIALTGPEMWVHCAAEWLQLGLEREGIGAKTRAGYGRMRMNLDRLRSPAEICRHELEGVARQNVFNPGFLTKLIEKAESAITDRLLSEEEAFGIVLSHIVRDTNATYKGWLRDPGTPEDFRSKVLRIAPDLLEKAQESIATSAARVCLIPEPKNSKRFLLQVDRDGTLSSVKSHTADYADGVQKLLKLNVGQWFKATISIEGKKIAVLAVSA